jgi:hypothetical protein
MQVMVWEMFRRRRLNLSLLLGVFVPLAALPEPSGAGPNAGATIVLHAVALGDSVATLPLCAINDPCLPAPGEPVVEIDRPGTLYAIYVLARHHQHLCGIQWALEWPTDWTYLFAVWACQSGQLGGWPPMPQGPGPLAGSVATAFNCIDGPATAIIGFIVMRAGTGCLEVIESAYPDGTHALGPRMEVDPIGLGRRGRVCVGPGGLNTCDPVVPVESATWGAIKATYE